MPKTRVDVFKVKSSIDIIVLQKKSESTQLLWACWKPLGLDKQCR
jgi:hypothetical protein